MCTHELWVGGVVERSPITSRSCYVVVSIQQGVVSRCGPTKHVKRLPACVCFPAFVSEKAMAPPVLVGRQIPSVSRHLSLRLFGAHNSFVPTCVREERGCEGRLQVSAHSRATRRRAGTSTEPGAGPSTCFGLSLNAKLKFGSGISLWKMKTCFHQPPPPPLSWMHGWGDISLSDARMARVLAPSARVLLPS